MVRRATAIITLLVGLTFVIAGIAHDVGITKAAIARHGVWDTRHVVLLIVGWSLLAPGLGFLASAWAIAKARAWGYPTALAIGGFSLVEFVIAGPTLGTPPQWIPAVAAAVAYLILVAVAWRRERAVHASGL